MSIWPEEQSKCDTYFIYLYLHCAYWLIVMTIDHIVKARHHNLRINGYLDFYQATYQLIRMPLFITSLWNTCYLLLAVILHHTHKVDYERYCRTSEWFTPLNYIFLLTVLELMIIVPAYINYISKYFIKGEYLREYLRELNISIKKGKFFVEKIIFLNSYITLKAYLKNYKIKYKIYTKYIKKYKSRYFIIKTSFSEEENASFNDKNI